MTRPPNNAAYRMGDGLVYVYDIKRETNESIALKEFGGGAFFYFDYISIGAEDFEIARQEAVKLEVRLRILQCKKLTSLNVVKIEGLYYRVWKVNHTVNKHGVPVTDITVTASLKGAEPIGGENGKAVILVK